MAEAPSYASVGSGYVRPSSTSAMPSAAGSAPANGFNRPMSGTGNCGMLPSGAACGGRSILGLRQDEADATMQAFSQWLSEMKARSNSSLQQMMAEMGIVRDGITANSTDLTEYKRHSVSIQQQMQSQLTDLREKLTSAYGEIAALVKQKSATDQELLSEISTLQQQLSVKTAELETLKKSYSSTHQKLQTSLIQIQGQLQSTSSEIHAARRQVQAVQEGAQQKWSEVEGTLRRLHGTLESTGREGQTHALQIQDDIASLHEALTGLSADFFDHKRLTLQVQNKLTSQVSLLEEGRRRAANLAAEGSIAQEGRTPTSIGGAGGFGG